MKQTQHGLFSVGKIKKHLFIFLLWSGTALSQTPLTVIADSAISLDSNISIMFSLPVNHKLSILDFTENRNRISGWLTVDSFSVWTFRFPIIKRGPGTYSYSIFSKEWSNDPCSTIWKEYKPTLVQVGRGSCTAPVYVTSAKSGLKLITSEIGLCPSCLRYKLTLKRLNATNPLVKPVADFQVLGTSIKFDNYNPTINEAANGFFRRTYSTSFDGFWYQVDVECKSFTTQNKRTSLTFISK